MHKIVTPYAAIILLASSTNIACTDSGGEATAPLAQVRVLHLSPGAPAVDVWVNGSDRVAEGISQLGGTFWVDVESGFSDVSIVVAGGDPRGAVLVDEHVTLQPHESYTIVLSGGAGSLDLRIMLEPSVQMSEGGVRLRAISTATSLDEVDLWSIPESGSRAELFRDLAYWDVSPWLDLPQRTFRLGLDVDDDAVLDSLFEMPAISSESATTIFVADDGSGGLVLMMLDGSDTLTRIDPKE
jgi:hypothetical protein